MEKISCDIVRDLMPGYLDGICSEDSKRLVDEHMEQCPVCKVFLQQVQKADQGKETAQVDGLRKVRQTLDLRILLCFAVCVIVFLLMGTFSVQWYGSIPQSFFRISLPLLMLTYYGAFAEGKSWRLPKRPEWLVPVVALALVVGLALLQMIAIELPIKKEMNPSQLQTWGPFIAAWNRAGMIMAVSLLVVLAYFAKKREKLFLISQNVSWLALHLALSFGSFLRDMNSLEEAKQALLFNGGMLLLEFVVVVLAEIVPGLIRRQRRR